MATRKTWIWVLVGVAATGVVALVVVAGAGAYFVTHHIKAQQTSAPDALRAFETALTAFPSSRPLYELAEGSDQPQLVHPLSELPTSAARPETMFMLAWDPDEDRLVRVELPFWLLRLGRHKMQVMRKARGFNFDRLSLDMDELERIGPALVFDFRNQDGVRVLLWTQ